MSNPRACIMKTDGTNCDEEMSFAFQNAGAEPEIVHINQFRDGSRRLKNFGILGLAGGFANGDDLGSGKVLGIELASFLSDQLNEHVADDKPLLGICNGFQALVQTGLLPFDMLGTKSVSLTPNASGNFVCRWVDLAVGDTACKFAKPEFFEDCEQIPMQIAHAEGRFFGSDEVIQKIKDDKQVVFRYTPTLSGPPSDVHYNPNGSMDDIAGICDPFGLILGMMPHPERSAAGAFHPDRVRTPAARSAAEVIFTNIVKYAQEL